MTDDNDDRSIASVATYKEADHGHACVLYVSDADLIEPNSPHTYRNVIVQNCGDDNIEPSSFTREDWIQLGRAIGGNTTITRLVVSVDDPDNGDDPIRSTCPRCFLHRTGPKQIHPSIPHLRPRIPLDKWES